MATFGTGLSSLWYDIKKYYNFNPEELRALIIGILSVALIISFDKWGVTKFDLIYGLKNYFNAFLIVTLSFIVHVSAQRIVALVVGFKAEYRVWLYGIAIGLVLVVVSNGKLWFIAPGGILVYHMVGHRLGSFRYGLNFWPLGLVGISGPVASIVLAGFFKILLYLAPGNLLLQDALIFNIWYALFTMLPIPPLDGSHMFFASRLFYVFAFGAMIGFSIAIYFLGFWISLLIGLLFGISIWFINYKLFE